MTNRTNQTDLRRRSKPSALAVLAAEAPGLLTFSGGAVALLAMGAFVVGTLG